MAKPIAAQDVVTLPIEQGRVALRVNAEAMRRLQRQTETGLQAFSWVGAEVGGLLLGSASQGAISIEAIRELPCEHRYGPSFLLSDADRAEARRIAAEPSGKGVLGFYRTQTRDGELLQPEDIDFAATLGAAQVIAIVQPEGSSRSIVRIFLNGGMGQWLPAGAFSLPDLQPVNEKVALRTTFQALVPKARPSRWWAAAGGLLALLLVLNAWLFLGRRTVPSPAPGPAGAEIASIERFGTALDLRIERGASGDIRIMWNRSSAAVASAAGGWLRIVDGVSERNLDLDVDQLRSGNLLYVGVRGDVLFRLEVFDSAGRATAESVRLIGGAAVASARPAPRPQVAARPSASSETAPPPTPTDPTPPAKPAAEPKPLPAVQSAPAPEAGAPAANVVPPPAATQPSAQAAQSQPAPAAPKPADQPAPSAAGQIAATVRPPQPTPSQTPTNFTPAPPPKPASQVQATTRSAQQPPPQSQPAPSTPAAAPPRVPQNSPESSAARDAPPSPKPAPPQTSADRAESTAAAATIKAKVIRQVRPAIPYNVRSMLMKETVVRVNVVVDQTGKVVRADPEPVSGVVGQMLASLAADAARNWRFEPARRNNVPISSNVELVFRFSR